MRVAFLSNLAGKILMVLADRLYAGCAGVVGCLVYHIASLYAFLMLDHRLIHFYESYLINEVSYLD